MGRADATPVSRYGITNSLPGPGIVRMDRVGRLFLDSMGGGPWPSSVGGARRSSTDSDGRVERVVGEVRAEVEASVRHSKWRHQRDTASGGISETLQVEASARHCKWRH
jgi:hypothetical protein